MADDNNSRYRQSDPFGRNPGPSGAAGQASDPLAELARLIGRNDPFADLRDSRMAAPQQDYQGYASDQTPQYGSDPAPHYGNDPAPRYGNDPAPRFGGDYPPRYDEQQHAQPPRPDWPGTPAPSPSYSPASNPSYSPDPFALPSQQSRMPGVPGFDTPAYGDPQSQQPADGYHSDHPSHDAPAFPPASDRPSFLQQPPLYPREPEAGAMPPPHDDEFYDDAPRGRRKGLLTVAAVLALAVLGTGVALGYRSFFGGTSSSSPPPVIRANNEPSKVAPPSQPADPSASKFSYDRFGDRGQNEQVVTREEKPVDSRELGRSAVPRTVLPGAPNPPTSSQSQATGSQGNNPPSALGEPRRVRTVPIRPDGPDTAAVPRSSPPQANAPLQVAPPPTRQSNTVAEAPANPPPEAAAPRPTPPRNSRTAVRTTQPQQPAPADSNAPLSLSPDNQLPPPTAAREVPPPPAPRASAPSRVAAAPAGNGGGYLVQVSSQKSEADAQSSYRSIQSKYSSVLSGQRHVIRRADLGSRGVYYRAMVGPFGSRDEAIQLCTSLKAAGGDCVIQSN